MRPGQAGALLGCPAEQLLDANIPLADLWGSQADRLAGEVRDDYPIAEKLGQLANALLTRTVDMEVGDPAVESCVSWLARHPRGSVERLANEAGLGLRQLRRRFRMAVGKEDVDRIFAELKRKGANIVKAPEQVFWGGYSGYFADPDGHQWEVAFNPFWTVLADGRVSMVSGA
jgi:catechol 2,3-dioxygenase-like lactoylglutathione lyase family enzyme